jgi:hypothetical protein
VVVSRRLRTESYITLQIPLGLQHSHDWIGALMALLHILGNRIRFVVVLNLVVVVL